MGIEVPAVCFAGRCTPSENVLFPYSHRYSPNFRNHFISNGAVIGGKKHYNRRGSLEGINGLAGQGFNRCGLQESGTGEQ